MTIMTEEELMALRRAGKLAGEILKKMLEHAQVGMTTGELDAFGEALMLEAGAQSAPQVAVGFPGATCISVNEEVAHGIPGERILKAGDVLNIDVSLELDGFFADNAYTIVLEPSEKTKHLEHLCQEAKKARDHAIKVLRHGAPLNMVGKVIEERAKKAGYSVVRNLCSHGIGRKLHEEPEELLGYYDRRDKRKFIEGMVVTVEPFLSTAARWVEEGDDGWTLMNRPGGRSAQFEHTILIRRNQPPEILTPCDYNC